MGAWSNSVEEANEFSQNPRQRMFQFGEFFAGYGGFSKTVEELGRGVVEVSSPEGWDILTDEGLQRGLTCAMSWTTATWRRLVAR